MCGWRRPGLIGDRRAVRSRRCALPMTAFFEMLRQRPISAVETPSSQSLRSLAMVKSVHGVSMYTGFSCSDVAVADLVASAIHWLADKRRRTRSTRALPVVAPDRMRAFLMPHFKHDREHIVIACITNQ